MKKIIKKLWLTLKRWERQIDGEFANLPEVERKYMIDEFNNSTY